LKIQFYKNIGNYILDKHMIGKTNDIS